MSLRQRSQSWDEDVAAEKMGGASKSGKEDSLEAALPVPEASRQRSRSLDDEESAAGDRNPSSLDGEGVIVCCRIRPLNSMEKERQTRKSLRPQGDHSVIVDQEAKSRTMTFNFHRVFDESSSNVDIFESTVQPLVDSAMDGIHGAILCYGQTGSGKTYTMFGAGTSPVEGGATETEDPEDSAGLVPRAFHRIFKRGAASSSHVMEVQVAVLEIYQDVVYDLLNPQVQKPIRIYETKRAGGKKGLVVPDATWCEVASASSADRVIQNALANRRTEATKMNAHSSRSHCLVVVSIVNMDTTTSISKIGQLYLVDLAGSERANKTGVSGKRLGEAGAINKSLLTLSRVIKTLVSKDGSRIPYRDSKLTRLLQNSLGGSARCALCVNVSPAKWNLDESISTLRFGDSTSKLENKPVRNEVQGVDQLQQVLTQCHLAIRKNRARLENLDDQLLQFQRFFVMIEGASLASGVDYLGSLGPRVHASQALQDAHEHSTIMQEEKTARTESSKSVEGAQKAEDEGKPSEENIDTGEDERSPLKTLLRSGSYVDKRTISLERSKTEMLSLAPDLESDSSSKSAHDPEAKTDPRVNRLLGRWNSRDDDDGDE